MSSANTSGDPPATTIAEAKAMLGFTVDVYLDAGATPGPQASTIVDCVSDPPRLVREGVISVAALSEIVPDLEVPDDD